MFDGQRSGVSFALQSTKSFCETGAVWKNEFDRRLWVAVGSRPFPFILPKRLAPSESFSAFANLDRQQATISASGEAP